MSSLLHLDVTLLVAASLISAPLALQAWRRREVVGAVALAVMALAVVVWTVAAAGYLLAASGSAAQFWVAIEFIGITAMPPAWMAFALVFTGRRYQVNRGLVSLAIMLGLTMVILVGTNGHHEWVWRNEEQNGQLRSTRAVVYWLFAIYSYGLCIAGLALLFERVVTSTGVYRKQSAVMVLAGIAPLLTNVVFEFGGIPTARIDPTPFGFLASVVLVWWGLFRFGLLDLIPVARAVLLDSLSDAVLVIDAQRRILDLNRAARQMVGGLAPNVIGRNAADTIPLWPQLDPACQTNDQLPHVIVVPAMSDVRFLEVRAITLRDHALRNQGHVLLLRDVTDRHRIEAEREALVSKLQAALAQVKTLTGLLPVCAGCKQVRDEAGSWHAIDAYLIRHTDAQLTHSLCPACMKRFYPGL